MASRVRSIVGATLALAALAQLASPVAVEMHEYSSLSDDWFGRFRVAGNCQSVSETSGSERLLFVQSQAGLNNQVRSVLSAIAYTRILNRTLVIPHFHGNRRRDDDEPVPFDRYFDVSALCARVRCAHACDLFARPSTFEEVPRSIRNRIQTSRHRNMFRRFGSLEWRRPRSTKMRVITCS